MKENLRSFFIKLFAISIAVIIIINLIFNILLGERLEKIDKIISLGDSSTRNDIKLKEDFNFKQSTKDLLITSQLRAALIFNKKVTSLLYCCLLLTC